MSLSTTTLSAAITSKSDPWVKLASVTGITPKNTVLRIDAEYLEVLEVNGLSVRTMRGVRGSVADTHTTTATVHVGDPADHALPVIQTVGYALATTVGATAGAGHLEIVLPDGTRKYIGLSDSAT